MLFSCSTYHLLVVFDASSNSTGKIVPLFSFCISLRNFKNLYGILRCSDLIYVIVVCMETDPFIHTLICTFFLSSVFFSR